MPATVFSNPIFPGAKVVTATLTVTNTSGSYSNTVTDNRIVGSMKPYALEIGDPSIFNDKISITTNAGSYTVACSDVAGETTIKISFLKIDDDPTAVTSTEFDILEGRIGTLANLTTTEKGSLVGAVNEVKGAIPSVVDNLTSDSTTSALSAAQGKVLDGKTVKNDKGGADAVDYCQIGFNAITQVPEIWIHDSVNNTWYHESLSQLNQTTPNAALDGKLTTTDYSSNLAAGQSGTTLGDAYLKKVGNVITMSCVLSNSSTSAKKAISAYNPLVTFPSTIGRPSQHIWVCGRMSDGTVKDLYVSKYAVSGDSTKGQVIYGDTLTLPASGWIKFNVTWIV